MGGAGARRGRRGRVAPVCSESGVRAPTALNAAFANTRRRGRLACARGLPLRSARELRGVLRPVPPPPERGSDRRAADAVPVHRLRRRGRRLPARHLAPGHPAAAGAARPGDVVDEAGGAGQHGRRAVRLRGHGLVPGAPPRRARRDSAFRRDGGRVLRRHQCRSVHDGRPAGRSVAHDPRRETGRDRHRRRRHGRRWSSTGCWVWPSRQGRTTSRTWRPCCPAGCGSRSTPRRRSRLPPGVEGRHGRPGGPAFALPDAAAVDAAYAQLVEAGHRSELAPFDAFWGQRYATVLDPDGTGVDLFAPLPGGAAAG